MKNYSLKLKIPLLFFPIVTTVLQWLQNRGFSIIKQKFSIFVIIGTTFYLLLARSVYASNHLTELPGYDFKIQDILGIITGLACWFTRVALIFIVVAIIYYGLKFLMAQGDPTKLNEAKKSFLWGLVGVLVILGTYTIIATVANALGADYTLFLPLQCSF